LAVEAACQLLDLKYQEAWKSAMWWGLWVLPLDLVG
jgi:hypothetical protein